MDKLTKAIISSAMTGALFLLTSLMAVYPPPPALVYSTILGSLVIFITHCRPSFEGDDDPPVPAPGQIPPDPSPPNECRVKTDAKDDAPKFPPLGVFL